jgi:hypothetical protein
MNATMKHTTVATLAAMAILSQACTQSSQGSAGNVEGNTASGASATAIADVAASSAVVEEQDAALAVEAPDASSAVLDAAPAVVHAGARTVALRAGQRPARGTNARHGSTAWTVLLAVSSGPSAELSAVFDQARALQLAVSLGELSCSPIVAPALPESVPQGGGAMAVVVNFRSEREARAFVAALTEAPAWVGQARVMCAD